MTQCFQTIQVPRLQKHELERRSSQKRRVVGEDNREITNDGECGERRKGYDANEGKK